MANRKVLFINLGNFGSTGTIMKGIGESAESNDFCCYYAYPGTQLNKPRESNDIIICSAIMRKVAEKIGYYTGLKGGWLFFETKRLMKRIDEIKPEIIHLHNLHDTYVHLPLLFNYIKKHKVPIVWTLHDSWSFTGHCPYFTMAKCEKWKIGCHDCPNYRDYPSSFFDNSKRMWKLKKKWFTGVENMTIVTPSQWLADLVKQSFLGEYPVRVIHNGIDLAVFKPTPSDFREKYQIRKEKKILLGVAFDWGIRKGLDVFVELSKRLAPEKYQIVLVGTDEQVDRQLPTNIISIHRTQNQTELAEIYTAADVFVNPTREEVLGLVNIEANACGTPVITFNTGGSPECINEKSGMVIPYGDIDAMKESIEYICDNSSFSEKDCIARAASFDQKKKYREYLDLYETIKNGSQ